MRASFARMLRLYDALGQSMPIAGRDGNAGHGEQADEQIQDILQDRDDGQLPVRLHRVFYLLL